MAQSLLDPNTYESMLSSLFSQGNTAAQSAYDQSNSALGSYLSTLQNQQSGAGQVNLPLMAFAAGLGAPTKTGSFGESLSSAMSGAIPAIQSGREAELSRAAMMAKIGVAKANLGSELVDRKLALLQTPAQGMKALSDALSSKADANFMTGQPPGGGTPAGAKAVGAGAKVVGPQADAGEPATPSPVPSNATAAAVPPPAPATPPPGPADVAPVAQAVAQVAQQTQPQAEPQSVPTAQATPTAGPTPPASPPPDPSTIVPPKIDIAKAPGVTPLVIDKDWTPGEVDLGGGVTGHRPSASQARQLDAMSQIAAMGQQYRGSAKAAEYAKVGQEYMKQYTDKGYYWDPQTKTLVGWGQQDPQAQARLRYATDNAAETAKAQHELVKVPTGPNGLGPERYDTKQNLIDQANAPGYIPPGVKMPDDGSKPPGSQPAEKPIAAPGEVQKLMAKELVETRAKLPEQLTKMDKAIHDAEEGKRLLSEFQTGAGAEWKGKVVEYARSLGLKVESTAGWNPEDYQQLMKLSLRQVFDDVAKLGGRVLVSEIQGYQQATYSPGMQPEANRAIMANLTAATKYAADYQKALAQHIQENPYDTDISSFALQWKEANHFDKYYKHEMMTTVAKGATTPIPKEYYDPSLIPDNPTPGMTINTPKGTATWKGEKEGWVANDFDRATVRGR